MLQNGDTSVALRRVAGKLSRWSREVVGELEGRLK